MSDFHHYLNYIKNSLLNSNKIIQSPGAIDASTFTTSLLNNYYHNTNPKHYSSLLSSPKHLDRIKSVSSEIEDLIETSNLVDFTKKDVKKLSLNSKKEVDANDLSNYLSASVVAEQNDKKCGQSKYKLTDNKNKNQKIYKQKLQNFYQNLGTNGSYWRENRFFQNRPDLKVSINGIPVTVQYQPDVATNIGLGFYPYAADYNDQPISQLEREMEDVFNALISQGHPGLVGNTNDSNVRNSFDTLPFSSSDQSLTTFENIEKRSKEIEKEMENFFDSFGFGNNSNSYNNQKSNKSNNNMFMQFHSSSTSSYPDPKNPKIMITEKIESDDKGTRTRKYENDKLVSDEYVKHK